MTNKSYRPNWPMRLAAVLLCMTLISVNLLSGIYASYSVTATASDSARVARFDIQCNVKQGATEITKLLNIDMTPGATKTYTLEVANASEVAVNYTITAQLLTNNIPLTMVLDGATKGANGVYANSGTFEPNDASKTYTLTLNWPGNYSSASLAGEVDAVRVVVRAEQID